MARLQPQELSPRPKSPNDDRTKSYRDDLTPSMRIFVYEAIKEITNGKARKSFTKAAIRAGYAPKRADMTASRLMHHPTVKAEIEKEMKKIEKKALVDASYVVKNIKEIGERCMTKVPVLDEDGKPTGTWKFDSQSALRSQELLGKTMELFTDKVKQSGDVKINITIKEENVGKMEKKV